MWTFAKSVIFGTLVASIPLAAIMMIFSINSVMKVDGDEFLLPSLWLVILPFIITFPIVLSTSLIVGLPLTVLLKRNDRETALAYTISGAMVGLAIPLAILTFLRAAEGLWIALLGMFSGTVTAHTWWRSAREPNLRLQSKTDIKSRRT